MACVRILIANGVNMDLLGSREPEIYGDKSLANLEQFLLGKLPSLVALTGLADVELTFFQSNCERDYLEQLNRSWQGIILNPGAWTHTSLAIADRLAAIKVPFMEVHLSNVFAREAIRQLSYVSPHADGVISGLGFDSYLCALLALLSRLKRDD